MPNRLAAEKSPYLLQHAGNPVDWYPWGDEAFEAARREDKPIFLSIGYATCHWCHVMERESFEDSAVARLLNRHFISVKVDREERPDIDQIYMTVCQALTGHGGWPLTIVMAPDRKPFFAATYIGRDSRYGRPGMTDLLPRIHELWTTERSRLSDSAEHIADTLRKGAETDLSGEAPDAAVLDEAYHHFAARFDSVHGGFAPAPKFPSPHNLVFLLRYAQRTGLPEARHMAVHTLQRMRAGGIYDHLGFGFHRYATDDRWLVPHFEKMLYDQAGLVRAYLEAFRATGDPAFARTAREILAYVERDLTSPDGAFYSAEDADSEGEEGRFYVWTSGQLREHVTEEEARLAESAFGFAEGGNYRDESTGRLTGTNIPHTPRDLTLSPSERDRLEAIRTRLLAARSRRVRPLLDDKVLTDWNGMMIGAFAQAAWETADPRLLEPARRAADFVLRRLRTPGGDLLHRFRDGEAGLEAHLDDYAFLVEGLIDLYQVSFEVHYLSEAVELTHRMIQRFSDPKGGFSFTATTREPLLVHLRETHDGATPSGNSTALLNLVRLARLTGDPAFEEEASRLLAALSAPVRRLPAAHTRFLTAVDFLLGPSFEVVVVGDPQAPDTRALLDVLRTAYNPRTVLHVKHTGNGASLSRIAPFTAEMAAREGRATAYVCRGNACEQPTTDPSEVAALLAG